MALGIAALASLVSACHAVGETPRSFVEAFQRHTARGQGAFVGHWPRECTDPYSRALHTKDARNRCWQNWLHKYGPVSHAARRAPAVDEDQGPAGNDTFAIASAIMYPNMRLPLALRWEKLTNTGSVLSFSAPERSRLWKF